MIIELVGAPGSGKTSLIQPTVEHFKNRSIDAMTVLDAARPFARRTFLGAAVQKFSPGSLRRPLLWQVFYHLSTLYRIRFYTQHPRLIHHVLVTQIRRPTSNENRWHVLYWFFHLIGYYEFLRLHARPDEVLIFDEGFAHRTVQFNASAAETPCPEKIHAYIDLLPQPDLVIVPWAPLETCERRVYERGLWERFRHKPAQEVSSYLANAHKVTKITVEYLKQKNWNVIEIDNSQASLTEVAAELDHKLAGIPFQLSEKELLQPVL